MLNDSFFVGIATPFPCKLGFKWQSSPKVIDNCATESFFPLIDSKCCSSCHLSLSLLPQLWLSFWWYLLLAPKKFYDDCDLIGSPAGMRFNESSRVESIESNVIAYLSTPFSNFLYTWLVLQLETCDFLLLYGLVLLFSFMGCGLHMGLALRTIDFQARFLRSRGMFSQLQVLPILQDVPLAYDFGYNLLLCQLAYFYYLFVTQTRKLSKRQSLILSLLANSLHDNFDNCAQIQDQIDNQIKEKAQRNTFFIITQDD